MTQKNITNILFRLKKYQIKPTLLQIFSPKQTFFYCLLQPSLYLSTTKWQTNRFDYQHKQSDIFCLTAFLFVLKPAKKEG
jgi:hypothetical protein